MKEDLLKIFSDESSSKSKRYNSICAISGKSSIIDQLLNNLKKILTKHGIKEVKFSEIKTHKSKIECAKEFFLKAIEYASNNQLRIDVIIWDLQDSRHSIPGRDDEENFKRIYFHLLRHIVESWKVFNCNFYPDERSTFNYNEIIDYLNSTKYPRKEPFIIKMFKEEKIKFNFCEIIPQKSENNPLVQLADLFAGFACFSKENADIFKKWKSKIEKEKYPSLFGDFGEREEDEKETIKNRFEIIELIKSECKKCGIKVSLNTNNYLKTFDPNERINFWHYEPQGEYDKAPIKKSRNRKRRRD